MSETVSINITTCNRAHMLARCIRSVMDQSYPEIEINIINDASEDTTDKLLKTLQAQDARIHTFRNEHRKGNAACRNILLQHSSGEYIAFLDDDDYWIDDEKLTKQVDQLRHYFSKKQAAICCTDVLKESANGREPAKTRMPENIVKAILKGNGFIYNSTVLTTRHTLNLTGGFDEKMKRGVDSDFFRAAIIDHQAAIEFTPEMTTVCTVHGKRMTSSKSFKDRQNIVSAHFRIIQKYRSLFINHPDALLRRLFKLTISILKP